ncbi:aldose 1-epimerase family protein [Ilyomonas limi]|uniref:Aldose 1-epimerase family protein n=1 Tax=Ilyomonas limi TaxID=2575867 RepID=A0A4V6XAW9_9BACT|nr:aldose 1-epimerase family protein [Ilyomonas limi]TKK69853.1 aldose 1-epimerase family protein [Ilyomonas limi]
MPFLANDDLRIDISTQGAELQSIFNKHTKLEYLWNGDPAYWAKRSPVLFPIVGELKNHQYIHKGKTYPLSRHGFARDKMFTVSDHGDHTVTLTLTDSSETLEIYPFHFNFSIQYTIDDNRLYVVYEVKNTGKDTMYFSVGGHPAFNVPLTDKTDFEDYYLVFSRVENTPRYPLSSDGLIEAQPVPMLHNAERLPLKRSLFYEDAIVFKHLQSASITLESDKTDHGLIFYFEDFPYLGLWSKRDANFLCIEPWCGIADSVNATGVLTEKEGIIALTPGELFERQWSVEVF